MEDIEVLNLQNEEANNNTVELVKKKDINKKDDLPRNNTNPKNDIEEKKKEKKRIRKCEKVFLLLNILIILGIIGIYAYRMVYFYKLSHDVKDNIPLKEKLTNLANIAYQDDGLYEKNGYFYFKGSNVNNYVYYSGRVFRIIDINDGIRMIEDDTTTNLVWGISTNYSESIVHTWLTNYLNTLKEYEVYLKENSWCNENVDVENYKCSEKITDYVGLLSTEDYLQAGGRNSYLNNETYFWTINNDSDGKPYYINNEGSINNISFSGEHYYSYGIRPVITLNEEVSIISGDGSKNDPFVIEELGNALLRDNSIGSYVKYSNQDFRILDISDDGVTLISSLLLEVEKNYNDTIKYLNNDYLKSINKNDLVKINYAVSEYNYGNKYNYIGEKKNNNYVTIPNIGDLFLNEYVGYWLNNVSDNKLGLYYIIDTNRMFFGDLKSNKHFLRPVIKLNSEIVVTGGLGMKDNPLLVGENNVEEN